MKIDYSQFSALQQFYNLASDFLMSNYESDELPEELKHAGISAGFAIIMINVRNREEIEANEEFEDFFDEIQDYDEE